MLGGEGGLGCSACPGHVLVTQCAMVWARLGVWVGVRASRGGPRSPCASPQVLSGCAIIVRGQPRGGPPPERQINLSNIRAGSLARRAAAGQPDAKDTPDEVGAPWNMSLRCARGPGDVVLGSLARGRGGGGAGGDAGGEFVPRRPVGFAQISPPGALW